MNNNFEDAFSDEKSAMQMLCSAIGTCLICIIAAILWGVL